MAAGLGFKTFTTGEVLTAADTNGYLMQGVLVFASAAARDAAITSPQEGQCCYLKDTDAVLTYSGAAWVGFDDSNAIQNSIVDAKGDLVAASGADTPARLAVGSNGETLVADSAATTGLRYQAGNGLAQGIINGSMDIWQRGTTFTVGSAKYICDRFYAGRAGAVAGGTWSRQASGYTGIQYCLRVARDNGNTATNSFYLSTTLESANSYQYAGQTVTVSFYARKGANYSQASGLDFTLSSGTGTDQNVSETWTGNATVVSSTAALTTSWARYSATGTVSSSATEIGLNFSFTPTGTAGAADYFEITGVQLELGSVATQLRRAGGTIQGELAACQRYYYRFASEGKSYASFNIGGYFETTIKYIGRHQHPVAMRTNPTTLDYANLSIVDSASTFYAVSSAAIDVATNTTLGTFINFTVSGATIGRFGSVLVNNNTGAFLGVGAEL
jgi:hypothetical protein